MIVVTGCPRSGTSLMMDILRHAYGDGRIIGSDFPMLKAKEMASKKRPNESDNFYNIRMYINSKNEVEEDDIKKSIDMNPNGFWECAFTVPGINYSIRNIELIEKVTNPPNGEPYICKIVSQGIMHSNPMYIDKMIIMMRHPRAVAKSQERLTRKFFQNADGEMIDFSKEIKVHTPSMFINVTLGLCKWLVFNPNVPTHIVQFDKLLESPDEEIDGISEFLGGGKWNGASKKIKKSLNRSLPENVNCDLWEDAEFIYENFLLGKYQEIISHFENPKLQTHKSSMKWFCPRAGRMTNRDQCINCRTVPNVTKNFINFAEKNGIDWLSEPCPFECGFSLEDESMSIEDSIKNNFWALAR